MVHHTPRSPPTPSRKDDQIMPKPFGFMTNFHCSSKSPKVTDSSGVYMGEDLVNQSTRSPPERPLLPPAPRVVAAVCVAVFVALVLLGVALYFVLPRDENQEGNSPTGSSTTQGPIATAPVNNGGKNSHFRCIAVKSCSSSLIILICLVEGHLLSVLFDAFPRLSIIITILLFREYPGNRPEHHKIDLFAICSPA